MRDCTRTGGRTGNLPWIRMRTCNQSLFIERKLRTIHTMYTRYAKVCSHLQAVALSHNKNHNLTRNKYDHGIFERQVAEYQWRHDCHLRFGIAKYAQIRAHSPRRSPERRWAEVSNASRWKIDFNIESNFTGEILYIMPHVYKCMIAVWGEVTTAPLSKWFQRRTSLNVRISGASPYWV